MVITGLGALCVLLTPLSLFADKKPALLRRFFPEEKKTWELKNYQTVRINTRNEKDHTYLTRLSLFCGYEPWDDMEAKLEIQPFAETRYLWDDEEWSRTETGLEAGLHFMKWVYVGESFQYAWLKGAEDTPELETRLELNIPFPLNSEGYTVTLVLIEEYTFALEPGKGTRNEVAANLIIPVYKHFDFLCGWRHVDRIHDFDSDQVELTGILKF